VNAIAVNVLSFLGAFLAVFAANAVLMDLMSEERKRVRRRMEDRLRQRQRDRARQAELDEGFSQIARDALSETKDHMPLVRRLSIAIEQSGVEISLGRLLFFCAACAMITGVAGGLVTHDAVSTLAAAALGALVPVSWIYISRSKRLTRLRNQLPDALELMARVLRSGQTVSQAMQAVADEFARPIGLEFLYCYEQMNLGLSAETALRNLAKRTGLLEIKIFVLAVVVHRQTGGNLAELLDKLSQVVRERFRILGMISALTAQGRFQGLILLSLPPFMFVLLMVMEPQYEMILLQHPMYIVAAGGMMAVGALWIRKIVNFDF
jgi:tight adherence protein B